jgi:hypothetical protein
VQFRNRSYLYPTPAMKPDEQRLLRLRLRCLGLDVEFQAVFVVRIAGVRGEETPNPEAVLREEGTCCMVECSPDSRQMDISAYSGIDASTYGACETPHQ